MTTRRPSEVTARHADARKRRKAPIVPGRGSEHAEQAARLVIEGLEVPPSLNNAYANDHGRRVLIRTGRNYKAEAMRRIAEVAAAQGFVVPAKTPLRLTFRFWFARNNRDGSNAPKLLEDALSAALGFNDVWVWESMWTKAIDKDNPRCDLTLEIL